MATAEFGERDNHAGRIFLAGTWGAWIIGSGVNELAEGEWAGWIFVTVGVLITLTLLPMLRTEARSRSGAWTGRDTTIAGMPLLGVVALVMRALFADLAIERTIDLAIAPAWIALAAAFVLLRRQNVSRET